MYYRNVVLCILVRMITNVGGNKLIIYYCMLCNSTSLFICLMGLSLYYILYTTVCMLCWRRNHPTTSENVIMDVSMPELIFATVTLLVDYVYSGYVYTWLIY